MGSFCSCLQGDYFDQYANHGGTMYRNCMCLRCFIQQFVHAYTVLFPVGAVQSSRAIETTPITSGDGSMCDTFRAPPRPLPYDDPRFSHPQRDWLVARREKSASHLDEESEPLRSDTDVEESSPSSTDAKWSKTNYDTKMKRCGSGYDVKLPLKDCANNLAYFFPSSEDEDVCPTCLEEYTPDNPRIVTQCSHHFHLGCIYEWMERSDACPVCGKTMVFNET